MTKATSCCNTNTHYTSREVQTCSTEFMMQVMYLKMHYHLWTKLILHSRGKITTVLATSTHVQQFAAQENPDRSWIPPRTSFLTAHWLRTHLENRIYLGWQKWCSRGPDEMQPQAYSELYSVSEKTRLEHCQQNQITGISICSLTDFFSPNVRGEYFISKQRNIDSRLIRHTESRRGQVTHASSF